MKALELMLTFSLLLSILPIFCLYSFALSYDGRNNFAQSNGRLVFNRNTGKNYATIQEAINAPETQDGHEVFVSSGTYYEHVTINKSLSLVGEDTSTTIIDGNGSGRVVYVTANNVNVINFTIQNGTFGLWLHNSQNSKIIGNTLQKGSYGLRLSNSRNSEILENNVYGHSWFGVELHSSGNSTFRNNVFEENKYNFGVDGTSLVDFVNDIDTSNTVDGKPVHYLINQHNIAIDDFTFPALGYLAVVNSTDIELQNLEVQDNVQGLLLAFSANSTIRSVNAKNNWNGIYIAHSQNVSAVENVANNNFDYGIKFFNSSHSSAIRNNVDNNGWSGIGLFRSHHSTVDGNEANSNTYNLHIVYTNNSVIAKNNARNKPGGYSIAVYYSHDNLIYHNTFDNSLLYVETRNWTRFTPRNSWDNGLEGNFWSIYRDYDADQDGIGDRPYVVGENNVDNYPLMGKLSDFTVSLGGKTLSISIISNSTISRFQFSPDDRTASFIAAGFSETMGFSRIAVPDALLQILGGDNMTFLINGRQPALLRRWTDEMYTYSYFSYVNTVPELTVSPWLVALVACILLSVSALAFVVFKKKNRSALSLLQKKGESYG